MRILVDASIFLKLLLDEPGADNAQKILEAIEDGKLIGYVTPMVLEEVSYKLIYAKASELLGTSNIWRIREALAVDIKLRKQCINVVKEFHNYIDYMLLKGLRVEHVDYSDWEKALHYIQEYGLLPADAIHLAVASRLGIDTIATFDENYKKVKGIRVIP